MKKFPCYCCAVSSSKLVTPCSKEKCFRGEQCKQEKCFHHEMINNEMMEIWQAQNDALVMEYAYLSDGFPVCNSTMFLTTKDELHDESNANDVNFQPTTANEALVFSTQVTRELPCMF